MSRRYVLYHVGGPELVQIDCTRRFITSRHDWKQDSVRWEYVEEITEASIFETLRLVQQAKDHFVRSCKWIRERELTTDEDDYFRKNPSRFSAIAGSTEATDD